jgi:hypothetical protein
MVLARVVVSALVVGGACGASGAHASNAGPLAPAQDVRIEQPLKVDVAALMGMKTGQQVVLDLPRIGRQRVTFEATTRGVDGLRYWHGRLGQDPRDRIYLKETRKGLIGGVRFGGKLFAVKQVPQGAWVQAATDAAPTSTQAFAMGPATAPGVHPLASNLAAMAQAEPGTEWALPLPGGETEVVILTKVAMDEHGFQQISGISRLDGVAQSTQITVGPDAVFGTVHTVRGEYQVLTRQGRTEILDPRAAGLSGPTGDDHVEAPSDHDHGHGDLAVAAAVSVNGASGGAVSAGATATAAATASTQPAPLKAGTVDTQINLLVAYSPSLVALWGTESAARTRLMNLVEVANLAYLNSGTGVRFRVVGWRLVKAADATPQVQLDVLRRDAGAFAGTALQRQASGAAMTVFVSPFNAVTSRTGTCGLAYVPAARAAGLAAYRQQAPSLMFSSINDGQHGSSYCESLTLAHELGHNLGAAHDKANSSFAGVFDYSYGKGTAGQFGTVMSYIQPKVALFSSPQLTCTAKKAPCGTSSENVVATVLQTKSTVAALGRASATAVATDGSVQVAGWVLQPNGSPHTAGGVTLTPSVAAVGCSVGSTGLYNCRVPAGVNSVTLRAAVGIRGRTITPSIGTFAVDRASNTPVNATRFYVK